MLIRLLHLCLTVTPISALYTWVEQLEVTDLSPLLRFEPDPVPGNTDPSAGWVTDEYGTWTNTTQDASVSISWWGGETLVYGNLSRVITRVDSEHVQADTAEDQTPNDWWQTWPQIQYRQGLESGSNADQVTSQQGIAFRTRRPETRYAEWGDRDLVPYQRWNVTFELDQTSTYGRLINISRVIMGVGLPAGPPEGHSTTLVPAPETIATSAQGPDDWSAPMEGTWVSTPAPFNTVRYGGRQLQSTFPPATFDAVQATAARVLSTNTTDAPLRLHAPEGASLFVLYGAVGPEQGGFAVRLSVLGDRQETDFYPHDSTRTFSANRQEEAMSEVLAAMWLDPRLLYDVEIVSGEEGRNLAIQAVAWTQSPLGETEGNWWSYWNDQALGRGGLSGGQIAGIVVGSVLGAAIILGLALFFWRRRRKRGNSNGGAKDGELSLSPSHTLTSDAATFRRATTG